jgi:hypothetical protein
MDPNLPPATTPFFSKTPMAFALKLTMSLAKVTSARVDDWVAMAEDLLINTAKMDWGTQTLIESCFNFQPWQS